MILPFLFGIVLPLAIRWGLLWEDEAAETVLCPVVDHTTAEYQ